MGNWTYEGLNKDEKEKQVLYKHRLKKKSEELFEAEVYALRK